MKQWSGTDKVNETSVRRIEHVFFFSVFGENFFHDTPASTKTYC